VTPLFEYVAPYPSPSSPLLILSYLNLSTTVRMKTASPLLSVLLAAPLFTSLIAASPVSNTRTQQIVFADVEDATRLDSASRQGDLVDSMIMEAKAKGQDLSFWGIDTTNDKEDGSSSVSSGMGVPSLESIDLNDEVAKAKLMWEAAMENSLVSIQPVSASNSKAADQFKSLKSHESVKAAGAPGSGWIWQACGSGQEAAVLQQLDVSPDPPLAGKNLTVKAKGIVHSPIHVRMKEGFLYVAHGFTDLILNFPTVDFRMVHLPTSLLRLDSSSYSPDDSTSANSLKTTMQRSNAHWNPVNMN
jgi:hypothetical protein